MSRGMPRHARRFVLSQALLALGLVGSALLLGSLYTSALVGVALVGGAACAFAWWDVRPFDPRAACTLLVVTALGLVAFTALQTVPLPSSLVARLAPRNADVWSRALSALREPGPAFASLSLDPASTRIEVLRGATYLVFFLAAVPIAARSTGVAFIERLLVLGPVVVAFAALMHPAFGWKNVFGSFEPIHVHAYDPRHIGPLLNVNHFSAYLNIGFAVALAVLLAREPSIPRPLAAAALLFLLGVRVWSGSRGATLAMAASVVVVLLGRWVVSSDPGRLWRSVIPGALATLGFATAILAFADEALTDLVSRDTSKAALVKDSLRAAVDYSPLGMGRGAFGSTFAAYRGNGGSFFTHPENLIAQWSCEWGIPVAVLALSAIAFALRPKSVFSRSNPPLGPWAAICATGLHNMVDYNSEVPGVMVAVVVAGAAVVAGSGSTGARHPFHSWAAKPKAVALMPVALVLAASVFALPARNQELDLEQRSLHQAAMDPNVTLVAFRALAREALLRHPADPYLPFLGGARAVIRGDESPVPWIGRALERASSHGRAHLVLARWLGPRNASQSRLEYRLAMEQDRELVGYVTDEAPRLVTSFDDAIELVPRGAAGEAMLELLASRLASTLPATAARLDHEHASRAKQASGPRLREAGRVLADLRAGERAPWCHGDRAACLAEGLGRAEEAISASPETCAPRVLRADLLAAGGETSRAIDELGRDQGLTQDRAVCQHAMVDMALALGDEARVTATLDAIARSGCHDAACGELFAYLGGVEERRGRSRRALTFHKRGYELWPGNEANLEKVAKLAVELGLHGEASDAIGKLARAHPEDPRWQSELAREKDALSRSLRPLPVPPAASTRSPRE